MTEMNTTTTPGWGQPRTWAIAFALVDVMCLVVLQATASATDYGNVELTGVLKAFVGGIASIWNWAHLPMRLVAEPLLFPVVTADPLTPGSVVFLAFAALGVLQSAIVGYVFGAVVARIARRR